ncbi:MAG TPA: hypothetical protein VGH23_10305 [Rhizomicrobium sp.]|jgi:hypothetical protein
MRKALGFVLLGFLSCPALAQTETVITPEHMAELRAEQAVPRQSVPFDPKDFDKFVGEYQLGPSVVFWITRDGSHYLSRLTGQVAVEVFPESQTKFFSNEVRAQISFDSDAGGHVTGLVLHQAGLEQPAPRISEDVAKAIEDALAERIRNNTPSLGTEAALRHQVESMVAGERDYAPLMPALATIGRAQWPVTKQTIAGLGALKSLAFKKVGPGGQDIYTVTFERGQVEWRISPLTADGKISAMGFRILP